MNKYRVVMESLIIREYEVQASSELEATDLVHFGWQGNMPKGVAVVKVDKDVCPRVTDSWEVKNGN